MLRTNTKYSPDDRHIVREKTVKMLFSYLISYVCMYSNLIDNNFKDEGMLNEYLLIIKFTVKLIIL